MARLRAGLLAAALATAAGTPLTAVTAMAEDCPGHPDAIGTSRVISIAPGDFSRLGRMQYPDSLPLNDKEVVLTFDDGPLPPYSTQILDILAAQCVKVTYFLVGEMAHSFPATVRRIYAEGHTIGTHSDHHPSRISHLPIEKIRAEIDGGIAEVATALGDPKEMAPFFRVPGLDRSEAIESEAAARSLVVFSSDTVADDWHRHIKPDQIISLAIGRLSKLGKGILLLHDIHPTTVAALPGLLKELKDHGFHIVQVVAAPASDQLVTEKPQVLASALPDSLTISESADNSKANWPKATGSAAAESATPDAIALPAPDVSAFEPDTVVADGSDVQWPDQPQNQAATAPASPEAKDGAARKPTAALEPQKPDVTGSIDRDSEHHNHFRPYHRAETRGKARAGNERRRAATPSGFMGFAAMFTRPAAR